jgi:hypothetical protein
VIRGAFVVGRRRSFAVHNLRAGSVLPGHSADLLAAPREVAFSLVASEYGDVIEMTEPQVWTLIGVFAAALFGVLTLMSTMFLRVIRAEIGGLRAEMGAEFGRVHDKIDSLDRDVQALTKRIYGVE